MDSFYAANGEGKPVAVERPKPALQETVEESAMESVTEESKDENSAEELVRSSSLSADAKKSTEEAGKHCNVLFITECTKLSIKLDETFVVLICKILSTS